MRALAPWTAERVRKMAALWAAGYSASQVAAELGGTTRNAVIGRIHRMKLPKRVRIAAGLVPKVKKAKPKRPAPAPGPRLPARPLPSPAIIPEEPMPVEPTSLHLSVMDLRADSCRFPHGDPKQPGFSFCGAKVHRPGSAWCRHHRAIVYRPVESRQGRAAA